MGRVFQFRSLTYLNHGSPNSSLEQGSPAPLGALRGDSENMRNASRISRLAQSGLMRHLQRELPDWNWRVKSGCGDIELPVWS